MLFKFFLVPHHPTHKISEACHGFTLGGGRKFVEGGSIASERRKKNSSHIIQFCPGAEQTRGGNKEKEGETSKNREQR